MGQFWGQLSCIHRETEILPPIYSYCPSNSFFKSPPSLLAEGFCADTPNFRHSSFFGVTSASWGHVDRSCYLPRTRSQSPRGCFLTAAPGRLVFPPLRLQEQGLCRWGCPAPSPFCQAPICSHTTLTSCPTQLLTGSGVLQGVGHSFQKLFQVSRPPVIHQVSLNFAFFSFSHPGQLFVTVITCLSLRSAYTSLKTWPLGPCSPLLAHQQDLLAPLLACPPLPSVSSRPLRAWSLLPPRSGLRLGLCLATPGASAVCHPCCAGFSQ